MAVIILIRGIIPDLSKQNRIFGKALNCRADFLKKFIRKLVCNIQAPARCPKAEPLIYHAEFACYKINIFLIFCIKIRQVVYVPPASVGAIIIKSEPASVLGIRMVICPF